MQAGADSLLTLHNLLSEYLQTSRTQHSPWLLLSVPASRTHSFSHRLPHTTNTNAGSSGVPSQQGRGETHSFHLERGTSSVRAEVKRITPLLLASQPCEACLAAVKPSGLPLAARAQPLPPASGCSQALRGTTEQLRRGKGNQRKTFPSVEHEELRSAIALFRPGLQLVLCSSSQAAAPPALAPAEKMPGTALTCEAASAFPLTEGKNNPGPHSLGLGHRAHRDTCCGWQKAGVLCASGSPPVPLEPGGWGLAAIGAARAAVCAARGARQQQEISTDLSGLSCTCSLVLVFQTPLNTNQSAALTKPDKLHGL